MKIKIEKDHPMPTYLERVEWPFDEMKVQDSFEIPSGMEVKVATAMSVYGKRKGKKFARRANRVWRIK